ncbi:MAG TPA: Type 1 glutamine amidotransferase-like domain-containing protein [Candidatus Saccharimonadales bacterium]|nr:Type 1 glutamine amidotransferase-like domain-containing protein [Candidatus Saccharimonadales bacterium]
MKRLILIGGHPGKATDDNVLSYALRTHPANKVNIAFCNYAHIDTQWKDVEKELIAMFEQFGGGKSLAFKTLSRDNFNEVSEWAGVIYITGGNPAKLKSELDKHEGLDTLWDGKIITGSSAGADIMCEQFVYLQEKTLGDGYGWVRATMIPHWGHYDEAEFEKYTDDDFEFVRAKALKSRPDLPVLCIPEGQFVEIAVQ